MEYDDTGTRGSVTHLLDLSGKVIEKYKYDVFGYPTVLKPSGAVIASSAYNNRFLFTGREYNSTFGIYEYRARAYHPILGRFMSEDPNGFVHDMTTWKPSDNWSLAAHPEEGELNLFRCCGNDPLDFTDPTGLEVGFVESIIPVWSKPQIATNGQ